jgi:hypothetical protein
LISVSCSNDYRYDKYHSSKPIEVASKKCYSVLDE